MSGNKFPVKLSSLNFTLFLRKPSRRLFRIINDSLINYQQYFLWKEIIIVLLKSTSVYEIKALEYAFTAKNLKFSVNV